MGCYCSTTHPPCSWCTTAEECQFCGQISVMEDEPPCPERDDFPCMGESEFMWLPDQLERTYRV